MKLNRQFVNPNDWLMELHNPILQVHNSEAPIEHHKCVAFVDE